MQCLIEMINMPDEEEELKLGIQNHIIDLAYDINGTHVLQKTILCLKEDSLDYIFTPLVDNLRDLALDQNGLCVIKKIISKINNHERKLLIGEKLSEHSVQLVQSPYGNYAVQLALEVSFFPGLRAAQEWENEYCEKIFYKLEPHLMQLSMQKFSSNVIEKILDKASYEVVERFMLKLVEREVMKSLIKNNYGYFVI